MQRRCMKIVKLNKINVFNESRFSPTDIKIYGDERILNFDSSEYFLIPPLFDTHIHGGWDIDVMGDPTRFRELEAKLISSGIFFAIPTLMNHELERIKEIADEFLRYRRENPETIFPFLRIEGPFISYEKSGAQSRKHILEINRKNLDKFLSLYPAIKLFTFAPELENSDVLVKEALKIGMIPSVGHSNGRFRDFSRVYKLGVRHFTHFGNAMRGIHQREIGVLGAGFYYDDVYIEFIGDLIHLSKQFIELLLKSKNKDYLFLISDMIPPAKGKMSSYGGNRIVRRDNILITQDGAIAGGSVSVGEQIKRLVKSGFSMHTLVYVASFFSHKKFFGQYFSITYPEKDFLIVDNKFNIKAVSINGRVFQQNLK